MNHPALSLCSVIKHQEITPTIKTRYYISNSIQRDDMVPVRQLHAFLVNHIGHQSQTVEVPLPC